VNDQPIGTARFLARNAWSDSSPLPLIGYDCFMLAKSFLSVLSTPEPTLISKFAVIGNTHRYILHDENGINTALKISNRCQIAVLCYFAGFEDSVLHNVPSVPLADLPTKIAHYLR